jgi:hypothetical protein
MAEFDQNQEAVSRLINILSQNTGLNIVLLNALPTNAFNQPVQIGLYRVPKEYLMPLFNVLANHNVKCFIGHPTTAQIIDSMIGVKCVRGQWVFSDEHMAIIFTLMTRAVSGTEVPVTLNDLLVSIATFRPGLDDPVLSLG